MKRYLDVMSEAWRGGILGREPLAKSVAAMERRRSSGTFPFLRTSSMSYLK